jgi:uncharacterized protein YjlB
MDLQTWIAPPGDAIPNHPSFPVLVYRGVDLDDPHGLLERHGWGGRWVDGVFDFHHFHSTSHETLAVIGGAATLELGGPQGEAFDVQAGDVLVLPAGTGHRRAAATGDFTVVGAYPEGQHDYDLKRSADAADRARIAALPVPAEDPVGGDGVARWIASGTA